MAKYCVFESTNMKSSRFAERIFDAVAEEDIENGTFGYLGEQEEEGSHVYKFKKGFKAGETVVVADQPAWKEDYRRTADMRRDKFVIPAGTRFRVRVVAKNDEFAITIEGVTTATRDKMKIGAHLTIDKTTGKLVAAETAAEGSPVMEAVVERKRIVGGTLATAAHNYGYANEMFTARVKVLG
nr:MAG TPA: hypothetical protein [Caudoviricetes sp.]